MADAVINPDDVVVQDAGTAFEYLSGTSGPAGEDINAGEWVFKDPATGTVWLATSGGTQDESEADGMCVASVVAGQQCFYASMEGTRIFLGVAVLAQGLPYVLSDTAPGGKMCPAADLVATNWLVNLGWAETPNVFVLSVEATGVQRV